jgi:hypothetical protein
MDGPIVCMGEMRNGYKILIGNCEGKRSLGRTRHIVTRMCGDLYKTGIGLTTGFIGSHTVTHNYSVYTLHNLMVCIMDPHKGF